ncbi:MAG TPA: STAS domain-containing protein [Nocardioides sp.]|nr:STAS domain-containing protein [Nocardioides sp.]
MTTDHDVVRLSVEGPIDIATGGTLDVALGSCLAGRPRALVLDMSGVTFLACAEASGLLQWWYRATKDKVRFGIVSPSPGVQRVLHAMRLDEVLVRTPSNVAGRT